MPSRKANNKSLMERRRAFLVAALFAAIMVSHYQPCQARIPPSHFSRHLVYRGEHSHESFDVSSRATTDRLLFVPETENSINPRQPSSRQRRSLGRADIVKPISMVPQRYRKMAYKDILNCGVRQWSWSGDTDENTEIGVSAGSMEDVRPDVVDQSYVDYRGRLEGDRQRLSHSPVVYQYYGRSRVRATPNDSVHFILLGPNVDHWKTVGQILASRGFNTIACERVGKGSSQGKINESDDTPNLVLDLMEALKWKKVILVGCDSESILAMETAMMLSPDQVVGLVLSGDLSGANQAASQSRVGGLDSFLQRVLDCPFLIVWDGDSPSIISGSSAHRALESNSSDRCVILGGGSAPHRLKPEQFAWVLTRFVEEKFNMFMPNEPRNPRKQPQVERSSSGQSGVFGSGILRNLNLPFGVTSMVSPEGRLLLGRTVAATLFYITAMRVVFVQYGILRSGLFAIKSRYDSIDALTKRSIQAVGSFIVNFGYIPRLFTLKRANEDEEDENRRSGTIVLKNQDPDEEDNLVIDQDSTELRVGDHDEDIGEEDQSKSDDFETPNENEKTDLEQPPLFKPYFFLDNVVT